MQNVPFSRFSLTKSAAKVSKEDSRRPPCNHWRRARVSRASHAWQACTARRNSGNQQFCAPHSFSHTTRANISHEEAEQIRARIACTPAEKGGRAWMEYVRRRDGECVFYFFIGCTWILSCRGRRYPVSATLTHTLRVCVNSLDDPKET